MYFAPNVSQLKSMIKFQSTRPVNIQIKATIDENTHGY